MTRYFMLFLLQLLLLSGLQASATAADDTTLYVIKRGTPSGGSPRGF